MTHWVQTQLEQKQAILHDGHFVLKSLRHASDYIDLDYMFPYTALMARLGIYMAKKLDGYEVDALVAPAVGGVSLLQWVAMGLTANSKLTRPRLLVFWADKADEAGFKFARADWQRRL